MERTEFFEHLISSRYYLKSLIKADLLGPIPWVILGYALDDPCKKTVFNAAAFILHCYAGKKLIEEIKDIMTCAVKSLEEKAG